MRVRHSITRCIAQQGHSVLCRTMLIVVVVLAGLVAGVTGAWSPCGFSMVETLAPAGYAGRLRTTVVACTTFAAGALAGGVLTFGGLGALRHAFRARGS